MANPPTSTPSRRKPELLVLGLILLLATGIRVWGLAYDLPYIYHPDEPVYLRISQGIFRTGDLNPHFFNYPSQFFYLQSLAYLPYYWIGKLAGIFNASADILGPLSQTMGVAKAPLPSAVVLGRLVSLVFGVGTAGLTYVIARRLSGTWVAAALAALIISLSPTNVSHSRAIEPDSLVVFFAALTVLLALALYRDGQTWQYLAAGLAVGLTASSKYNGGLVVLVVLAAHFLRRGPAGWRDRNLYLALLASAAGFLLTTPFALLDFPKFWEDFRFESRHYTTGHPGMEGNSLAWYLRYMGQTGNLLYPLALAEMVRGAVQRIRPVMLISIFPLVYFVFISSFVVRNDRTFLPLTPFLFVLAASFLAFLWDQTRPAGLRHQTVLRAGLVVLTVLALAGMGARTVQATLRMTTQDSREAARAWISANLPPGSRIAIEPYSPYLEPDRFAITPFSRLIDHTPDWYLAEGFDYIVFSEGMYGRFYREPQQYPAEVEQYEALFATFEPVRVFTGDIEIRVLQVR